MSPLEEKMVAEFRSLPPEKQQEVVDFIDFLKFRASPTIAELEKTPEADVSFVEAARKYIGCLDGGPEDLSTNKAYLEDFGKA